MADPSRSPDSPAGTGTGTGAGPDRESGTGTPRWVIALGIVAIVLVVLFVVALLAGGTHGPQRHAVFADSGRDNRPSSVIEVRSALALLAECSPESGHR